MTSSKGMHYPAWWSHYSESRVFINHTWHHYLMSQMRPWPYQSLFLPSLSRQKPMPLVVSSSSPEPSTQYPKPKFLCSRHKAPEFCPLCSYPSLSPLMPNLKLHNPAVLHNGVPANIPQKAPGPAVIWNPGSSHSMLDRNIVTYG